MTNVKVFQKYAKGHGTTVNIIGSKFMVPSERPGHKKHIWPI